MEELERAPRWLYEWELTPTVKTPPVGLWLDSIHTTREELAGRQVRDALLSAGPNARALDLGCNEGYFCHRLLEWGANEVVGIDIREVNVRRANLLRDHFGISPDRVSFHQADIFDLDPKELGSFDVVLLLGVVYHLDNPFGAVRLARALTKSLCVIESQLSRHDSPIEYAWRCGGAIAYAEASFAAHVEMDQETNATSSAGGVASLVPNLKALELMAEVAGFSEIELAQAQPHHHWRFVGGDNALLFARV